MLKMVQCASWFQVPKEDIQMLNSNNSFAKQDREISPAVLGKLSGHLWYLVPETAPLSFFDDEIPTVTKNLTDLIR